MRHLFLSLVLALGFTLGACGDDPAAAEEEGTAGAEAEPMGDPMAEPMGEPMDDDFEGEVETETETETETEVEGDSDF